jgi:hypothetical protein
MEHETPTPALPHFEPADATTDLLMVESCRAILALDRRVDARLRAAHLSRLDLDMLLDLLVTEHDGGSPCLWDVCQAASAPFSTAHRHLAVMIDRDLVKRLDPNRDWRRITIRCTDQAKLLLRGVAAAADLDRMTAAVTTLMESYRASHLQEPGPGE